MSNIGSIKRRSITFKERFVGSNLQVSVLTAALTPIFEFNCEGIDRILCQVTPGGQAFNAFSIEGKAHPDATYTVLYNAGFATPTGILLGTSGNLAALAANTPGYFLLDCKGINALRIQAKSAVANTPADVYISGEGA